MLAGVALIAALGAVDVGQPEADEAQTIIVTGERVPRSISETPSSVAVVTGEAIEARALPDRVEQLLAAIPNVQLGSTGTGPSIRGQDTTGVLRDLPAYLGGTRPRATISVDGRALGYFEFVFGTAPIWDVAQVEIFRSPQTTTQGRNSIAGAIFIETADPTWEWEGRVRALAGNYDTWQGSAALSGPILDDQIAFRLAVDARSQRPASDIADTMRGADPDHDDYGFARFKLLIAPRALPGASLETSYVHLESESPQAELVAAPFEERADPFAGYGIFRVRSDTLTGQLTYQLGPALTSATTISWGHAFVRRFAPPGLGESRTSNDDFSFESVLRWFPDGPVRLTGGVYHLRQTLDQRIDLSALPFIAAVGLFEDVQTSLGLFGDVTLRPVPRVTFSAGLRYERDTQDRTGSAGPLALDFRGTFDAWLPKFSLSYEIDEENTAGILVQRAFNPGGVSISFFTGEADTFDPETLWDFEAFLRSSLLGGRLSLEANLFFNAIKDAQRVLISEVVFPDGSRDFISSFANARRARSYGAELQFDWRASDRLTLSAGLGLLRTKIVETDEPASLDPVDRIEGKEFARAPHFTASAAIDWRVLPSLRLSAQLRHNSGYYSDDANYAELRVAGATVFDARIAWTTGPVTIFAYARNVFDRLYVTELFAPDAATLGDPRKIGIGIDARF